MFLGSNPPRGVEEKERFERNALDHSTIKSEEKGNCDTVIGKRYCLSHKIVCPDAIELRKGSSLFPSPPLLLEDRHDRKFRFGVACWKVGRYLGKWVSEPHTISSSAAQAGQGPLG